MANNNKKNPKKPSSAGKPKDTASNKPKAAATAPQEPDDSRIVPTTVKTVAGQIVETETKAPPKEEDDFREDNLEMSQLSFRKRWAIRKKRIKKEMEGMARMQKVEYLLSYFKWPLIFIVGGLLLLILMIIGIKNSSKTVILAISTINVPDKTIVTEEIFNDYKNYKSSDGRITSEVGTIKLDTEVHFSLETYEQQYSNDSNDYSLTQFPVLCSTDFFDVVITDRDGLDFCSASNLILDPETVISPTTVLALREHQANAKDNIGTSYFYAYDITDTEFAKSLGYEDKVYMAFPGSGDTNKYNAERFLCYLFGLELPPQEN